MIAATHTSDSTRTYSPRGPALALVDAVHRCGYGFADWCVSDARDAVWGHVELPDRDSVLALVQRLASLPLLIEIDVVPLAHDGRGRWSVKLRAACGRTSRDADALPPSTP
ncbi:MAG TPA: hypothetical protein VFG69_18020 [Nannocystaceae bacterium]|nr:hypothetical protein [Nannocystaceae bacterium]